ncbi:hypothetical protein [Planctopirus hydrillae]|nr:hypothetical protein [Planctopirus hydrillae]
MIYPTKTACMITVMLCAAFSAVPAVVSAQSKPHDPLLSGLLHKWASYSAGDRYSVNITSPEIDPETGRVLDTKPGKVSIKRDGQYFVVVSILSGRSNKHHYMMISNPGYQARLERYSNDPWVLKSLVLSTDRGGLPPLDEADRLQWRTLKWLANKSDKLSQNFSRVIDQGSATIEGAEVKFIEFELKTLSREEVLSRRIYSSDNPSRVKIYYAPQYNDFPVRYESCYQVHEPDKSIPVCNGVRFSGWQTVQGMALPSLVEVFSIDDKGNAKPASQRDEFDYSQWEVPWDRKEAYLTHYGLPEPEGVQTGWGWWWLVCGGVLLCAAVALIARRRASV